MTYCRRGMDLGERVIMDVEIEVGSSWGDVSDVLTDLKAQEPIQNDGIVIRRSEKRVIETAVLVAVVGATGTALGALITGLLKLASGSNEKTITVRGRFGGEIRFPAGISNDEVDDLIEAVKKLDSPKIILGK